MAKNVNIDPSIIVDKDGTSIFRTEQTVNDELSAIPDESWVSQSFMVSDSAFQGFYAKVDRANRY